MARKWFAFLLAVERFLKKLVFRKINVDQTAETQRAQRKKIKRSNLFYRRMAVILFLISSLFTVNISPVFSQTPQSVVRVVQQGKSYYDSGQYRQAVEKLQQAVKSFAASGDTLNQAITLSNLSLAYQELGEWQQAEDSISQSLEIIGFEIKKPGIKGFSQQKLEILAPVLDIYGKLWYKRSQPENALKYWQLAESIYQQLDINQALIQNRINQVQALQSLGLYQQARTVIEQSQQNIDSLPTPLKTQALLSLGDILRSSGDLQGSQIILEEAIAITKNTPLLAAKSWLSLGNTFYVRGNLERDRNQKTPQNQVTPWQCNINTATSEALPFYKQADNSYQQAINLASSNNEFSTKVQLNRLSLLVDTGNFASALQTSRNIQLSNLPLSRTKVYAQINLARELACLSQQQQLANQVSSWQEIDDILKNAVKTADKLEDKKAKSYAIGNRGSLYEYLTIQNQKQNKINLQNLKKAQKFTAEALLLAQPSEAPSIAYQWQWQLGRLANLAGDKDKAVANYQATVNTLELVRDDLLSINSDVQFSFRDNVEPVYRQLVNLLLTNSKNASLPQQNLTSAINLIDSLQLAELENFLRCNLDYLARENRNVAQFQQNAAFIYPIILKDRLEVIYKLPEKSFKSYSNSVTSEQVVNTAHRLRTAIAKRDTETAIKHSQTVYQWLIKPIEAELEKNQAVETLVFVLDTELRNIPMAILYDQKNKKYLIEKKYALSILPTSRLFNLRRSSEKLKILAGGISEALEVENRKFEAINAKDELAQIAELASTQKLLNQEFNQKTLQQKLQNQDFTVLHLATHGNFSSNPEQTYILAYDELLRPNDINRLLGNENQQSNRIELLVLSACQTAEGDNRATLGLAGLAVRAGADSTLATLWKVNDEFTIKLIKRFYQELSAGVSKSEALHRAQKALVYGQKYRNEPYDWGAYVLVGNWL
ncbi:MAG: CHAT domain-containing protein [Rivularia sp. (in: Bacteria)]|nr:CHAT domain-containing protein [Rivularia sp. MS3]